LPPPVLGDRLVKVAGTHRRIALAKRLAGRAPAGQQRQHQHANLQSAI
jgi:hypothetical protein